jgi:hypothetical protein
VNRHGDLRLQELQRFGRPARIEMPGRKPRPPPADREDRDVKRGELGHAVEEVGVAGEVDPPRALDDVPSAAEAR